jgi:hypothetical protein
VDLRRQGFEALAKLGIGLGLTDHDHAVCLEQMIAAAFDREQNARAGPVSVDSTKANRVVNR